MHGKQRRKSAVSALRRCSGVSVVESSLVTLGFFALVLGVMESGRLMSMQQTVIDAAREGARLAVAPASQTFTLPSDSEVETRVNYFLESNGIPTNGPGAAQISIGRDVTVGSAEDLYTQVTVTYPYKIMSLQMFSDFGIDLRGVARMRNETSP